MIAVLALFLSIAGSVSSPAMVDATSVSGPVQFLEIYFMSGKDLERRAPNVGEEFRVGARIRNTGSVAFYYLPTLCDSSLSAAFDPLFVKVETGRPRCLALSMPAPLNPGDTVTVTGPESGTAYVAIRPGSTDATVAFRYRMDPNSEEQEARSKVTLMIKDGFFGLEIPGFSAESVLVGLAVAFAFLVYRRKPVVKARVLAH
jgi:hypothetical protein